MGGKQTLSPELQHVADVVLRKVFQGVEAKRGLAENIASVAVAALQDHVAQTVGAREDEDWVAVDLEHVTVDESMIRLIAGAVRNREVSVPLEDEPLNPRCYCAHLPNSEFDRLWTAACEMSWALIAMSPPPQELVMPHLRLVGTLDGIAERQENR